MHVLPGKIQAREEHRRGLLPQAMWVRGQYLDASHSQVKGSLLWFHHHLQLEPHQTLLPVLLWGRKAKKKTLSYQNNCIEEWEMEKGKAATQ